MLPLSLPRWRHKACRGAFPRRQAWRAAPQGGRNGPLPWPPTGLPALAQPAFAQPALAQAAYPSRTIRRDLDGDDVVDCRKPPPEPFHETCEQFANALGRKQAIRETRGDKPVKLVHRDRAALAGGFALLSAGRAGVVPVAP